MPLPLVKVGEGVLIVKDDPVVGVTAVIPVAVIEGTGEAGIETVFPPDIDREFPTIDKVGIASMVKLGYTPVTLMLPLLPGVIVTV